MDSHTQGPIQYLLRGGAPSICYKAGTSRNRSSSSTLLSALLGTWAGRPTFLSTSLALPPHFFCVFSLLLTGSCSTCWGHCTKPKGCFQPACFQHPVRIQVVDYLFKSGSVTLQTPWPTLNQLGQLNLTSTYCLASGLLQLIQLQWLNSLAGKKWLASPFICFLQWFLC